MPSGVRPTRYSSTLSSRTVPTFIGRSFLPARDELRSCESRIRHRGRHGLKIQFVNAGDWPIEAQRKALSAEGAARLVQSGQRVYVQGGCATPVALLRALTARWR